MKKCTVVLALMMLVNIAIQAGAELKITGAEVKVTGGEIKIGNNGEIKVTGGDIKLTDTSKASAKESLTPVKGAKDAKGAAAVAAPVPVPAPAPVKLSGIAQAQIYYDANATGKELSATVKRVRVIANGDLGNNFGFFAQAEMFTNQVNVLDLVLDYNMQEYGKIGLGRFAVPFGIQNPISPFNLTTINYSQVVTRTFGAGRDFGIRWTGKYNIVDWMVAGINGNDGGVYAVNTADDNSIKDIVGRVGVTPVKGLGIGASLYSGKTPVTVGGVVISNLPKDRTGFDVKYELDPVYLQGEYITAKDNTTNKMGYYAEAGYKIGKFQPVARYEAYDGDTSVEDNSEIKILAPGLNFYPNKSVKLQFIYELKTDKLSTSFTDKYNDAWYFQSSVKF